MTAQYQLILNSLTTLLKDRTGIFAPNLGDCGQSLELSTNSVLGSL